MRELLSNEEIDTLLELFRSEAREPVAPEPEPPGTVEVHKIDLHRPNRCTRGQLAALRSVFTEVAGRFAAVASARLRDDTACTCGAIDQVRYASILGDAAAPHAIYVLSLRPVAARCMLSLSGELFYGVVDRVLGGSGRSPRVPDEFTPAEFTVADAFVGALLDELCAGLAATEPPQWSIEERSSRRPSTPVAAPEDVVIVAAFDLRGEGVSGAMRLAVPFTDLEAHLARLEQSAPATLEAPGARRPVIEALLQDVPVELRIVLGETTVPLRSLMHLSPGDVVPVGTRLGEPLALAVEGVPRFRGRLGRNGSRLAFRVASDTEEMQS